MLSYQGSTVARQASDKEKQKELPTYKDNDFINDGVMIHIGKEAKERLEMTLKADVDVSSSDLATLFFFQLPYLSFYHQLMSFCWYLA